MPTKHVTSEVMRAGGGKHWTKKEIAARKVAEEKLKRKKNRGIYPPSWLTEKAKTVWRRVAKSALEGGLQLDNLDTESLAIYCDAYAKYQDASKKAKTVEEIKVLLSLARLVAQLADKMGFSPTSRAHLVKRMADKLKDYFGEKFD